MASALQKQVELRFDTQFFEGAVRYKTAEQQARIVRDELIPKLQNDLSRAQGEQAKRIEFAIGQAREKFEQLLLIRDKTAATLNYLMGKAPGAAIQLDFTLEEALGQLQGLLTRGQPVATERRVLDAQIQVAQDLEIKTKKDLKIQELRTDPISPVVQEFGKLIAILTEDGIGNPVDWKEAEIQRQWAQSEREAYEARLPGLRAQARVKLLAVQARIIQLDGNPDPAAKLELLGLRGQEFQLKAVMTSYGDAVPPSKERQSVPTSFPELTSRLEAVRQTMDGVGPQPTPPDALDLDLGTGESRASSHLRYYRAVKDLDSTGIHTNNVDGWIEIRLKAPDTPIEVVDKLAQRQAERDAGLRETALLKARGQAQIFLARFSEDAQLLRELERTGAPAREDGPSRGDADAVRQRLNEQRAEIVALLDLPESTPLEALLNLVPEAPGTGREAAQRAARRAIEDVRAIKEGAIRGFLGRMPATFGLPGNELQAEVLAQWLSYKGLTLGAAAGLFRGQWVDGKIQGATVGGISLEAPDPRQIEKAIAGIITDSARRQIEAQGRWQELVTHVHLLFKGVQDQAKLLEEQEKLVHVAEQAYQAASAKVGQGLGTLDEQLSARDAMVKATVDLFQTLADLKGDFISLATELEAMGYGDKLADMPMPRPWAPDPSEAQESKQVLRHWSERMADGDFVDRLDSTLEQMRIPSDLRAKLKQMAEDYRTLSKDAQWIHRMDLPPTEKLELLARADVEGHRLEVEKTLRYLQEALDGKLQHQPGDDSELGRLLAQLDDCVKHGSNQGAKAAVFAFLKGDLETQVHQAEVGRREENDLLADMRKAYERDMEKEMPPEVQGSISRLDKLKAAVDDAKQKMLEDYLMSVDKPAEFIEFNKSLDRYLQLRQAFNAELLSLVRSDAARGSPDLLKDIDGLYDVRASIEEEEGALRHGRGGRAIDALIGLEESHLAALRYEHALPADLENAAVRLQDLKSTKDRWLAHPEQELKPLYVATSVDKDGHPLWDMKGWHAASEVEGDLAKAKEERARGVNEFHAFEVDQGKIWLVSKDHPHARDVLIVPGVDAARLHRNSADRAQQDNAKTLGAYRTLEKDDFAVLSMDRDVEGGLSFSRLMAANDDGRLFFFTQDADPRTALNPAVHPLHGLWGVPVAQDPAIPRDPKAPDLSRADIFFYNGDQPLPRDRFPTRQSLEDYLERLNQEIGADKKALELLVENPDPAKASRLKDEIGRLEKEAANFKRVMPGDNGVKAMVDAAEVLRLRSLRAGWLSLKMSAFGFAFPAGEESRGPPTEIYLTRADLDKALARLANAPQALEQAQRDLAEKKAEVSRWEKEKAEKDKDSQAIAPEYRRAEAAARERIRQEVLREARGQLIDPDTLELRIQDRLSKDKEYLAAKERLAPQTDAANKANNKLLSARRQADLAEKAVKDARLDLEHSRSWRIFRSADLGLWLDANNAVVGAVAAPAFGSGELRVGVGDGRKGVRVLSGDILAAIADPDQHLVRIYQTLDEIERALPGWNLEDVEGGKWAGNAVQIDPNLRFSRYVLPVGTGPKTNGKGYEYWPVLLNRQFMIDRAANAESNLGAVKRWAYMPRNWLNIGLEVPRSVLKKPIVMMTGEDPNQEGWRGWANAYKLWAGKTEHQNGAERALKAFDILELFPDKVDWVFDPSQLPREVVIDSPLSPAQSVFDKGVLGRGQDIYAGRRYWETAVRYANEDRANSIRQILAYFEGGENTAWLEQRRGMDGLYSDSRVVAGSGSESIERALRDPVVAAGGTTSNGGVNVRTETGPVGIPARARGGQTLTRIETQGPVSLSVDRVAKEVRVQPGAQQARQAYQHWTKLGAEIRTKRESAEQDQGALRDALSRDTDRLERAGADRRKADANEIELWSEFHDLAWRIGRQEAIEDGIRRHQDEIQRLEDWIEMENRRLLDLKAGRKSSEGGWLQVLTQTASWPMIWTWLAMLSMLAAAAIHLLRSLAGWSFFRWPRLRP